MLSKGYSRQRYGSWILRARICREPRKLPDCCSMVQTCQKSRWNNDWIWWTMFRKIGHRQLYECESKSEVSVMVWRFMQRWQENAVHAGIWKFCTCTVVTMVLISLKGLFVWWTFVWVSVHEESREVVKAIMYLLIVHQTFPRRRCRCRSKYRFEHYHWHQCCGC